MIAIAKARCEEERGEGRAVSNKSLLCAFKEGKRRRGERERERMGWK
jgi:hypothetical protein